MNWIHIYKKIRTVWIRFGNLLNKITSPILLGITYFLILTPIAWLYRLFNRTEEEQDSTMNERVKTYSKEDFMPFSIIIICSLPSSYDCLNGTKTISTK